MDVEGYQQSLTLKFLTVENREKGSSLSIVGNCLKIYGSHVSFEL